ncbi:MAG: replication-associated recombination protein A [Holosporales bacterium]|jgi:putative ATPase|nr:replication-associated recombination protein A [Holosporales bacterium]
MKKPPLADLLRPQTLEEIVENCDENSNHDAFASKILWGPPGCGKTSYARIIAKNSGLQTVSISAVTGSVQQFREVFQFAEKGQRVVLLVDEIHHLNKSQQDIFLPHLENGNIILIGTTTENPSFELRPAMLSRCKVIVFKRLSLESLEFLLQKAEKFLELTLPLTLEARAAICQMADGDGRYLLNMVEDILAQKPAVLLDTPNLLKIIEKRSAIYDKTEEHYNLISALHKSMRGSDVDASLYWMARLLTGGENPLYLLRRIVRFASEDIGMADPAALSVAIAAQQAYIFLGAPEGHLAIAHAVTYMATAPKSNAVYTAFNAVEKAAQLGSFAPPKHILNAPTKLMKESGYGENYLYDHDQPHAFSGQNYFPAEFPRQQFYTPVERGFEREVKKRLAWWGKLRKAKEAVSG